ncbi:hypothetical protein FPV67DRAFT_1399596, partial [Lyophyllum atratum]
YQLAGVIYHGRYHFTCRVVTSVGVVWAYDGMARGGSMIREDSIANVNLRTLGFRNAIMAVYAR